MADRVPLPVNGPIDLDNWGRPLTQAVNEHDQFIGRSKIGVEVVSFASANTHTRVISFGMTFPAAPVVFVNINSAAGTTAMWISRAYNINTADFTLFLFSADSGADAWSSISVGWMAIYVP